MIFSFQFEVQLFQVKWVWRGLVCGADVVHSSHHKRVIVAFLHLGKTPKILYLMSVLLGVQILPTLLLSIHVVEYEVGWIRSSNRPYFRVLFVLEIPLDNPEADRPLLITFVVRSELGRVTHPIGQPFLDDHLSVKLVGDF